ncbi:MAG: type II toxin-antitoxin system mRNA interferase toxin, RelE/StbE family [Chloroflexota bacterium]
MPIESIKKYKEFDPLLKQKVRQEVGTLADEPHRYQELKGPLKGIRSYHFEHEKTQYRIAYRIIEDRNQIEIVLVKFRERFYQALRRIVR